MTTYWRWQRRLMRRSLNIRIVFTARRTGRGLMKSGERSGAVKWKHSHPPDELTIVWWGDYLNNVQCAENALIQFSMKNILIYVQSTHTFVAHWIMFCLHCLGVMRNMKAREMLNYLHHLEFKFPAAATRYSPSLHPAEPSCVARIIPRRTVWRIREMISRSWLGPAVEEHFGKITKPCLVNQPKFSVCTHIL